MTQMEINKMLESTGGNYITLERITLDERAPTEIRLTAFLAINKKFAKSQMQIVASEVEVNNVKIKTDRQIE